MTDTNPTPPLVLASSSRYRQTLLARLKLPFTATAPEIDETPKQGETVGDLCARLSRAKARALAASHPAHLIIGSDQTAACGDVVLHKPGSHDNACSQLRAISGQVVTFYTGLSLLNTTTGAASCDIVTTEVQVRTLSDDEIERYLRADTPYDCAGSFKVEELGISLFDKVTSDDPTALIGLPLIRLAARLREQGLTLP